ncbi:energy transducer TonB [Rufibacter quisquiliarum]|uniref:Protein TonB n=1 Tax=Rufibacter quisquiliarum TaxID=1549639 RepID=A0A839GL19_9BACT|nr:energy transducer TonB [Rufibacter quisquiliarum]MBA9075647.1 protein TonB [Rufibacter quisquiliarum]
MENKTAPQATLLDMIFDGRNKAYGAYLLRRLYHRHLSQALLMAVSLSTLLISLPVIGTKLFGEDDRAVVPETKPRLREMISVQLPKIEEKVEPVRQQEPASPKPAGKTIRNVTYKVEQDQLVRNEQIPTQEDLKTANASTVTSEGNGLGRIDDPMAGTGPGTGGTGEGAGTAPEKTEIFISVQDMPEFEGGMKKLMDFVGRNLRYPRAAQSQGVEGTVVTSFVVSPTGELTDISILKGLGYGTEEEVVRVLSKMPRWKPGIQNGRAVPVRMTLPIRLELK